ncbi:hypothetical protein [Bacillus sp. FJAT-49736]|uniref:hypothetical protein n=1 Tax=Bacillus sp. FJAT-49736 TaxID=2833582 RepID=UPI001BC919EC|nr:hypothetical protein [Bacillus sp. FJAT-49736]MBS4171944.1 hypothetical protein [Bacillus sp. FJAT-49736]
MKKIHSIILKEIEFKETDDGFEEVVKNEKKYPVYLTNHALRRGRDQGIVDSSLLSDLLEIEKGFNGKKQEDAARAVINGLSEEKMLNVIYLAFLGANPNSEYTFDDFLLRYHGDYSEIMTLYINIVSSSISSNNNRFAKALQDSTKAPSSKEKK